MQGYDGPHRDFLGFGAVLTPITGYSYLSGFPKRRPIGLGTNYPDYVINPGHTLHRHPRRAALPQPDRQGPAHRVRPARVVRRARSGPRSSTTPRTADVQDRAGNRLAVRRAAQRLPVRHRSPTAAARWTNAGSPSPASPTTSGQRLADAMGSPGLGERREVRHTRWPQGERGRARRRHQRLDRRQGRLRSHARPAGEGRRRRRRPERPRAPRRRRAHQGARLLPLPRPRRDRPRPPTTARPSSSRRRPATSARPAPSSASTPSTSARRSSA